MASNYLIAKEFDGSKVQTNIRIKRFTKMITTKPKFDLGSFYFKTIKRKYNKLEYDLFKHTIETTELNKLIKNPPLKLKKHIAFMNDIKRVLKLDFDPKILLNAEIYAYFNFYNWTLQTIFNELIKTNTSYIEISNFIYKYIVDNKSTSSDILSIADAVIDKFSILKLNRFVYNIYYKLSEVNIILSPDTNLIFALLYNDTELKRFHKIFLSYFIELEVTKILPKSLKPSSAKISYFIDSQYLFLATNFNIDVSKIRSINTYKKQQLRTFKSEKTMFLAENDPQPIDL